MDVPGSQRGPVDATLDDLLHQPPVAVPPRPRRAPAARTGARGVRTGLRWTAAVTALVVTGVGAAGVGWRELVEAPAEDRSRAACVRQAAAAAQDFAAVLGDTRPVDRRALERSCARRA